VSRKHLPKIAPRCEVRAAIEFERSENQGRFSFSIFNLFQSFIKSFKELLKSFKKALRHASKPYVSSLTDC